MSSSVDTSDGVGSQEWLVGGGEMGERIRAFVWEKTPLGPPETWPQSLKAAVAICLGSRMPIVIWWDPKHVIQIYNDAYISFLGPTKHPAFLGRSGRECWQEIWDTMGPLWDKVFGTGEATWSEDFLYVIDRMLPREEGYFTFSYSPIRGEAGTVEGIFCACYETTGKIVGARRLETLRQLGEQAMEAGSIADACKRAELVLTGNPYDIPFSRIFLLDANGRLPEDEPADVITTEAVATVLQTRRPVEVDSLVLPGGAWPEPATQAIVLPLFASTYETITGLIVLGVSPRRPLDADYRAFFHLIAGQISTAMASANAKEEERKRAEALAEIDRAKTAFFSNVSHEFRTPLTLMLGPIEELLSRSHTELPPAATGQLELSHRNGMRLLRLVNTLLDFSRIEAGRVQAVFQPTDLAAFTTELASVFRAATERAGLRLTVDCPRLSEPVWVDREMWEKIVLNLVSNAFKFTFEGEIEVKLRTVGADAQLSVRDTGVGIPAEEMPRLFERFHRVPNMRSRTYEGSGIGLALIQELVKLHGGTVSAESRLGEGTTFYVRIPLGTDHLPPEHLVGMRSLGNVVSLGNFVSAGSTSVGAAPFVEEALRWLPDDTEAEEPEPLPRDDLLSVPYPVSEADPSLPRLLIADDNADMRHYLVRLLSERYQVQAVPDGQTALEAARERRPDLILSDIMMPRLDGISLLRELRADAVLATIPVILLSARAGEEARIEGLQKGADDYLVKPFSARELLARVAAHLDMAQLRKQTEETLRKSEAELREREERFRALVEASSDVVYRLSPDWTEMRLLDGRDLIPHTEEPSRTWLDQYIHPKDQPRVLAAIHEAIRTKSVFALEHQVLRGDGSLGWTFSRAVPMLDPSGEIIEWIGTASDITERKRMEEALEASERKARELIQYAPTAIYEIDLQTQRFTAVNDALCVTTGYSREELLQMDAFDLLDEPSRATLEERIQQWQVGKQPSQNAEYTIKTKDGRLIYAVINTTFNLDENGRPVSATVIAHDITERKQMEQARLQDHLQIELQRRLMEQREQDRYSIARDLHDGPIQTLSSLMFQLQMLKEAFPDPDLQTELGHFGMDIKRTVQELRDVLNELRPPALIQFGFSKVVRMYIEDLRTRFPNIEFELDVAEDDHILSKDVHLTLFRLFQEGINNIIRHADAGKVWIVYRVDLDGYHLELRDNGKGFEFKSDFSQLSQHGHYGLVGMKERAEAINGKFSIASQPGKGTRILVTGPLG